MYPFRDGDTHATFRAVVDSVTSEIKSLENEYVLKASQSELEAYFIDKVLITPLVLHADKRYIKEHSGTDINVSGDPYRMAPFPGSRTTVRGTSIDIAIPFEGDAGLWKLSASTFSTGGYPEININNGEIEFSIKFADDNIDQNRIQSDIERAINSLTAAVGYLEKDVTQHNNSAPDTILQLLARKRSLAESSVGVIAKLGIPVKRVGQEPIFSVPTTRRNRPAKRPTVETGKYQPEPALDEQEYQHILKILRSMSLVIERSPSAFATLDEESIRNHFLLQLNGHYEGGATGETFNASGKTDILIREDNKNVFIAECKFWRGSKAFGEAVDQLLGYLTWRDTKCALLIFNRTKNSSSVKQKMHDAMESLPKCLRTVFHDADGGSRYILIKETEPGKEIIVTTQLYDIPEKASL